MSATAALRRQKLTDPKNHRRARVEDKEYRARVFRIRAHYVTKYGFHDVERKRIVEEQDRRFLRYRILDRVGTDDLYG